jgi:hypothetical protein
MARERSHPGALRETPRDVFRHMRSFRRRARLPLLLAVEAAAVVAVHRLGSRPPFDLPLDDVDAWVHASPADALLAALRVTALAGAAWLFAVTAAYALARGLGIRSALGVLERATPHLVRRVVDHAVAASIVVGALAAPAHAAAKPPPVVVDVRNGRAHGGSLSSLPADIPRARTTPASSTTVATPAPPVPTLPPTAAPPAPAPPAPAPLAAPTNVVVQAGDNLWTIAADALAHATARDRASLDDAEIARYWRAVCDANATTVRSGNLDVIVPGEVIALPPPS